jgi:hypothetical protein
MVAVDSTGMTGEGTMGGGGIVGGGGGVDVMTTRVGITTFGVKNKFPQGGSVRIFGSKGGMENGTFPTWNSALGSSKDLISALSTHVGASLIAAWPVMNIHKTPNGRINKTRSRSLRDFLRVSSSSLMVCVH